ncbi:MAG: CusA/CzcA family heavy metal efflux RND transporter [Salinisphaeraceae bacterium]|jgi:cobalt-zinc-cadmium resistance protein CzcA|nr:CusA/CzcA family heavy metal efflux RND transporter [Salinisphaeraceae bacterium]
MIDAIVRSALNNRLMVLVAVVGLAIGGYLSLKQLPVDAFPDATPALVQIFTVSEGLATEDVETQISYPIEIAMYGLPGIEKVQSTSIFGLSRVDVYFEDGTDIYFARRLVLERLADARRNVPEGLGEPELGPITSGLGRIMLYDIENKDGYNHSLTDRRLAQDWIVKPQLRTVPGVTGVLSIGGFEHQYQVNLDAQALLARGITIADVRGALAGNNRNVGASFINRGGEEYVIRGYGWINPEKQGLQDIRNIVVSESGGVPILVGDIAQVEYGPAIRRGAEVSNGVEAVGGYVFKLIGTNTRKVLEDVEAKVEAVNDALPEGMALNVYYTQGELVDKAIGTVTSALLQGAVLVLIILYLFLGNLRSTLIVVASLPLSVLVAFIGMKMAGLSANLMSLGGLAIAIGMVVDGSVVMIENSFRHMEQGADKFSSMTRLVGVSAREVARPIVFASGIVIAVFLPIFTLQGVEGKLFSPMAYSISFALIGALVVALVLVPVLVTLFFRKDAIQGEPRFVGWLKRGYRPLRDAALKVPALVLGFSVLLFAASLALFPTLGSEFVPTLREGTIQVRSTLPPGASLESAIDYAKRIQNSLNTFPEVTGTYSRVGRAEVGGDPEPINVIATVVTLKPLDQWQSGRDYEQLQAAMSEKATAEVPGLANNFSQPIQLRTDELLSGVQAQLVASIYGDDFGELERVAGEVTALAKEVRGAVDVKQQQQGGKQQIVITPDREALARYGLSTDEILGTVEAGIGGVSAGVVFDGIRRYDIFLRLQQDQRERLDVIKQLPIRTPEGAILPLTRVADIRVETGPKQISRSNASRRIYVQMNVRGRDMGGVVEELRQRIKKEVDMPPGYFVEFGGQFENQERAMARLFLVVPVTLGLIFLLLFSAFNSLRYATLIFLNVPFAITGGIFALWISGLYVSVPAAVGFIAVFGVAVLNGVVLVSYINQLREEGMETDEAVRTGAEHRMRPVLMTALTSILGLIPLLLANGIGSNVQRPLAAVVIGGLVTSTLLTLLVLPSIYRWFAEPKRETEF